MLKRTVLDFDFPGDACAVTDAWAAKYSFAFVGDQDGTRLYYRDDWTIYAIPWSKLFRKLMSSGVHVSIRQSGSAVHFEAWYAVTGLLRLFGQAETRVSPGGVQGSLARSVNLGPVDALLASLGQPPVSQPPVAINAAFEPAGLGRRFAGVLIDVSIVLVLLTPVQAVAQAYGYDPSTGHGSAPGTYLYPLGVVAAIFAWIPAWSRLLGGAPGQLVLGMSLVDSETGGHLIGSIAFLRNVLWLLSIGTVIPGLFMASRMRRDPYHRAWLDRATLSMVVKKRSKAAAPLW